MVELTSGTDIICPKCHKEIMIEGGFFGSLLAQSVVERLKREGGTITGQCGHKVVVDKPKPKPEGKIKKFFNRICHK